MWTTRSAFFGEDSTRMTKREPEAVKALIEKHETRTQLSKMKMPEVPPELRETVPPELHSPARVARDSAATQQPGKATIGMKLKWMM